MKKTIMIVATLVAITLLTAQKPKPTRKGQTVGYVFMVIDTLNKDTVNWKLIIPKPKTHSGFTIDKFTPLEIRNNFTLVAMIDSSYKLHVYDSLATIQTLIKLLNYEETNR